MVSQQGKTVNALGYIRNLTKANLNNLNNLKQS